MIKQSLQNHLQLAVQSLKALFKKRLIPWKFAVIKQMIYQQDEHYPVKLLKSKK